MVNESKKMKKIAVLYEGLSEIGGLERVMINNYKWLKNKWTYVARAR